MRRQISSRAKRVKQRLEDRFERHVVKTRADSMALSIPGLFRPATIYAMEMALGGDRLTKTVEDHFRRIGQPDLHLTDPGRGADLFMQALGINVEIVKGGPENIPKEGPVLVVGNHPHGILEVMAGAAEVLKVRKDCKVLVNYSIAHNRLFGHFCLPIDMRGTDKAERVNMRSAATFRQYLKRGGVGVIAPAGAIADRKHLGEKATDWEWRTSAAKWARQTGATVVPIYCDSENGLLFHIASKLSMPLRIGMIYYQNWRMRRRTLKIAIGDPISPETLQGFPTAKEATEYLRQTTYAMENDVAQLIAASAPPKKLGARARIKARVDRVRRPRRSGAADQDRRAGSSGGLRY